MMAKELTITQLHAAKGYFHHYPQAEEVWVDGSHCYHINTVPAEASGERVWRKDVINNKRITQVNTEQLIYDAIGAGVLHQNGPWVKYGRQTIAQGIENAIDELDKQPKLGAEIQQETLQKL